MTRHGELDTASTVLPQPTRASGRGVVLAVLASVAIAALHPVYGATVHGWALTLATAAAAAWLSVVDVRTLTLPNRAVFPLAAATAVQAIAIAAVTGDGMVAGSAAIAGGVVFAAYAAMGAAGWFGFGDAKFAGALALAAGVIAGMLAIYILALAMIIGAAHRAIAGSRGRVAHGPDIAIATVAFMIAVMLLHL